MPAGFAKLLEKNIASWGWNTVPQTHVGGTVYNYPQGKVLGGSSSINAMVYTRGNEEMPRTTTRGLTTDAGAGVIGTFYLIL
jgi:choline dehydrogenase-like flavoprotein